MRTYDFENIIEMYDIEAVPELIRYMKKNSKTKKLNLSDTNLRGTDLSMAKNFQSSISYVKNNFEFNKEGMIVYKIFGLHQSINSDWDIKTGSIIEENVNSDRSSLCGCGINVATLQWMRAQRYKVNIWKCLIQWEWLAGVRVPYGTNGQIRTEKLQLIEII